MIDAIKGKPESEDTSRMLKSTDDQTLGLRRRGDIWDEGLD